MPPSDPTAESEAKQSPSLPHDRSFRQLLAAGATLAALGIALSLGSKSELTGGLFVVGFGVLLLGIHRLGRLGPG